MHRTKVRVVEDVLDANATIARANREDFERAGVTVVNLMSAPGAGKTTLLERVAAGAAARRSACGRAGGRRAGLARRRRGSRRCTSRSSQLETGNGFGGECHLDANMVRSALPSHAARRARPARRRERRQPRLPGRVPHRRAPPRDGLLGHRGRGQAGQVPADVPRLRAGADQQGRPAGAPRLRPGEVPLPPRRGPSGRAADARECADGGGDRGVASRGCASAPAGARRRAARPGDETLAAGQARASRAGRSCTAR